MTYPSAQRLLDYATHFARTDWQYTRLHDIKHIRYAEDFAGYHSIRRRLGRAVRHQLAFRRGNRAKDMFSRLSGRTWRERMIYRWINFRIAMETDKHLPDGILLNSGGIITHWEEDGEYLQMVQPTVGQLLAEFLLAEPDHPHAQKISAELDRIQDGYSKRAKEGAVDGRKG